MENSAFSWQPKQWGLDKMQPLNKYSHPGTVKSDKLKAKNKKEKVLALKEVTFWWEELEYTLIHTYRNKRTILASKSSKHRIKLGCGVIATDYVLSLPLPRKEREEQKRGLKTMTHRRRSARHQAYHTDQDLLTPLLHSHLETEPPRIILASHYSIQELWYAVSPARGARFRAVNRAVEDPAPQKAHILIGEDTPRHTHT